MTPTDDPRFARGLGAYHAGRHFEAHEHWEELWREEVAGERKAFLQALIQVAAAMHKLIEQRQPDAALRLLARASARLAALRTRAWEIDPPALVTEIERVRASIEAGGMERCRLVPAGAVG